MSIVKDLDLEHDHTDAWVNAVTGLGTSLDKVTSAQFNPELKLQDLTIRNLLRGDDLARKIVYSKPSHMLRKGWNLKAEETSVEEELGPSGPILQKEEKLGFREKLFEAISLGRAYGGSILIPGIVGAGKADQPLDPDKDLQDVLWLRVVDRRYITIAKRFTDANKADFGEPEIYRLTERVNNFGQSTQRLVHASRVIRFGGALTDPEVRLENDSWDDSVLQEAYNVLRQFSQVWQGVANGMTDWSQAVFKLRGLVSMIAQGKGVQLQKRMQIVNMARSMARAVLIDAEGEDFTRDQSSFTGIEGILDKYMMRLSSVVGMPVSLLFGRSPAGMNATGEMDLQSWYEAVATSQQNELKPKLQQFYRLLFRSKSVAISEPEGFEIVFNPLEEKSENEEADLRVKQAQVDAVYLDREVLQPEEVAISRFGDGYSTDTNIETEGREKALEDFEKLLKEGEKDEPKNVIGPPGFGPEGDPNQTKGTSNEESQQDPSEAGNGPNSERS